MSFARLFAGITDAGLLERAVIALESIALSLDRLAGPTPHILFPEEIKASDVSEIDEEELYDDEVEVDRRQQAGQ